MSTDTVTKLNEIKAKCEQYWNERGVSDTEYHAVLQFIHTRTLRILNSTYNAANDPEIRAALQRTVNGD